MNVRKFTGICTVFTPSTSKNAPPSHASSYFAKHVYQKSEKCASQWTASVYTYFTHAQTCDYVRVQSATQWTDFTHAKPVITFVFKQLRNGLLPYILFTHAQTCDYVLVQTATQWTASVHTLHMLKPVITFLFKLLRNGLLRYILYTCSNL